MQRSHSSQKQHVPKHLHQKRRQASAQAPRAISRRSRVTSPVQRATYTTMTTYTSTSSYIPTITSPLRSITHTSQHFPKKHLTTQNSPHQSVHLNQRRFLTFYPDNSPELGETYQSIVKKVTNAIPNLAVFDIVNESNKHSGPPNRESHFKLTLVADFRAMQLNTLVSRHRFVNSLLQEEIDNGVHALSLHMFTIPEWESRQQRAPKSPGCSSQQQAPLNDL